VQNSKIFTDSTISFEPLSLKQDCYHMLNYFPSLQFLRVKLIGIIMN